MDETKIVGLTELLSEGAELAGDVTVPQGVIVVKAPEPVKPVEVALGMMGQLMGRRQGSSSSSPSRARNMLIPCAKPLYKAGRNDLCPCGSGKKFKKCCIHRTRGI